MAPWPQDPEKCVPVVYKLPHGVKTPAELRSRSGSVELGDAGSEDLS